MPQTSPIMWTTMLMIMTILIYQTCSMIKFEQNLTKKKKKKNLKMNLMIKI